MTIRTRLSLGVIGVLLVSLLFMTAVLHYELVTERQEDIAAGKHKDPVEQEIAEVVLFYGLPTALVLGVASWLLVRRALKPLDELTRAAEHIHAGNLGERLPAAGAQDEIARLTAVFNQMMARLDDSFARTREFTLNASHELKTPLAILHCEMETALQDPASTPAQREQLASQLDEVQRLAKIVEGLTLLARADAGQLQLTYHSVRLDELVRDGFADMEMLARPARLKTTLDACETISVLGDRHRLRQLVLNLSDNAIKYNLPGGEVRFSLRRRGGQAELTVANTGAGIPPQALPRVFDPFYRGDSAHTRKVEGSGLGLSIARWIVTVHGGQISIVSEPEQMTTVTVLLPCLG